MRAAVLSPSHIARVVVVAAVALATSPARAGETTTIGVHPIWFAGVADDDRDLIDAFLDCVVNGSNTNQYWQGEAAIAARSSTALTPPDALLADDEAVASWLSARVASGELAPPPAGEVPLYLLFGGPPAFSVEACGRAGDGKVAGRRAGIALVRNVLLCWPTGDRLRTETQIAFHEIVETADGLLGYARCAADGTCEGQADCPGPCDTFVGLTCPGAPERSYNGCDGGTVAGWVVQKLSYEGREEAACRTCVTCGFTPRACGPDEPECAAIPDPPETPAPPPESGGCDAGGAPLAFVCVVAAALALRTRRRRS